MPVGNSDRGVGLWAGQIMFGIDNSNEYIDWWHDVLPGSQEDFDHEGRMVSGIFTPNLTVGLSNYVNICAFPVFPLYYQAYQLLLPTISFL